MNKANSRGLRALAIVIGLAAAPAFAGNPETAPVDTELLTPEMPPEADITYYVSGFAGRLTANSHHEVWLPPWDFDWRDSYIVGGALGFERPTRWSRVDVGAEVQLTKWFGDQTHWELNAMPIVGRYRFEGRAGPLRSASFGLGFSFASEEPPEELLKDGESNRFLIYWAAELEFGNSDDKLTPFLKLHHRSNGFGLIEEETGSNSVVLGLRRRF